MIDMTIYDNPVTVGMGMILYPNRYAILF